MFAGPMFRHLMNEGSTCGPWGAAIAVLMRTARMQSAIRRQFLMPLLLYWKPLKNTKTTGNHEIHENNFALFVYFVA
jgi:hypothetical protein